MTLALFYFNATNLPQVHYAHELEQEPPHLLPDQAPPAPWPAKGELEMRDVVLRYRPELPQVLKGLTMSVRAGEKIGIVGRYVANYGIT